ncbi:hypothetical protein [Desulfarculus baarsii]
MQAKTVGFKWEWKSVISIDALMEYAIAYKAPEERKERKLIFAEIFEDYWAGLFVSVRDQSKVAELQNANSMEKVGIIVRSFDDDVKPIEFNFFAINRTTKMGVYLHYHRSASLSQFSRYFLSIFHKYADEMIKEKLEEMVSNSIGTIAKRKQKALAKNIKGRFDFSQIIMPGELDAVLQEFSEIGEFSFNYSELVLSERVFLPFKDTFNTIYHKVSFSKKSPIADKIKAILESAKGLQGFRIVGKNEKGQKLSVVSRNYGLKAPRNFGEYDLNEIINSNNFEVSMIASTPIAKALISKCKDFPDLFER